MLARTSAAAQLQNQEICWLEFLKIQKQLSMKAPSVGYRGGLHFVENALGYQVRLSASS